MYKSQHAEYSTKESYIVLSDICKQEKRRRHIHSNDRKSSTMILCVPLFNIPKSSNYTAWKFGAFPQYSAHLLGQHESYCSDILRRIDNISCVLRRSETKMQKGSMFSRIKNARNSNFKQRRLDKEMQIK